MISYFIHRIVQWAAGNSVDMLAVQEGKGEDTVKASDCYVVFHIGSRPLARWRTVFELN